ncbi:transmembrane protein [Perilla frutescens var. hirtella]|uniref:Transmembrane protein n=1 Tax=Perilla frutescens var. hirtella TaxID=608512 RepID=A0AAD4NZY4_PERFH|nr:transmembrane protein [Perilla frutescens var. frutescens]KAH6820932.1 transmembrane protein [Perilla frutescens var. hirtella]
MQQQKMEKVQQHQWWRAVRSRLSYKNATIVVCLFNIITVLLLLQGFFYSSSSKLPTSNKALYRHTKESEDIRRTMIPRDLIQRVREIGQDIYIETEQIQQKDVKQTAAVDLISRLNNFRSYTDAGSNKALEEWRKRKMERARQRSLVKNGTASSQPY